MASTGLRVGRLLLELYDKSQVMYWEMYEYEVSLQIGSGEYIHLCVKIMGIYSNMNNNLECSKY